MEDEDLSSRCPNAPNDWMEHVDRLPDRPPSLIEERFNLLFALDVQGRSMHDMYVAMLPNQVCMVGLAPSHPLIRSHRRPALESTAEDLPSILAAEENLSASFPCSNQAINLEARSTPEKVESQIDHESVKNGVGQHGTKPEMQFVDSFPLGRLKAVNFDVDLRPGHSRLDIKESGRSGKRQNPSSTMLRPNSRLCWIESMQGECVPVSAAISGKLLEVNSRLSSTGHLLFERPCCEGHLAIMYLTSAEVKMLNETLISRDAYLKLRGLKAEDLH